MADRTGRGREGGGKGGAGGILRKPKGILEMEPPVKVKLYLSSVSCMFHRLVGHVCFEDLEFIYDLFSGYL